MTIEALDLLYLPSRDVAADLAFYRESLGARVVFAMEAMGTRVAEVALAPEGPRLVLDGHLAGDAPVLLHRVDDLEATLAELSELAIERRVELPLGPCATLRTPGGQRLGPYELTRPDVDAPLRRARRLRLRSPPLAFTSAVGAAASSASSAAMSSPDSAKSKICAFSSIRSLCVHIGSTTSRWRHTAAGRAPACARGARRSAAL